MRPAMDSTFSFSNFRSSGSRIVFVTVISSSGEARSRSTAGPERDRKSTRLNSSHLVISYAVFCLKKKNNNIYSPIHVIVRFRHYVPLSTLFYSLPTFICRVNSSERPYHYTLPEYYRGDVFLNDPA